MSNSDHIPSRPSFSDPVISFSTVLSEKQLSELFDSTKDLIQSISLDGRLLFVNRAWCETLGYSEQEAEAINIFQVIHSDHHAACQQFLQRLIAGEPMGLIEIPFVTKHGEIVVVEGNVALHTVNDKPIATRGIFRIITDRKAAEAEMRALKENLEQVVVQRSAELTRSETRFRHLVANMPGAVYEFCIDASGHRFCSFVSDGIFDLIQVSAAECLADVEVFFRQIPPHAIDAMEASIRDVMANLQPWLYEFPINTPTGEKWLRGNAMPQLESDGSVRWHGVLVDITSNKAMEATLHALNLRLNYLLSSSPAIIYTCHASPPYAATFISANIERLLGYTPQEFLATPEFWSKNIHPYDRDNILQNLTPLFTTGKHVHEYRFRHKNGDWRWIRDELLLVPGNENRQPELIGYFIDITEDHQKDLALEEAHNLLKTIVDTVPMRIFWKDKQSHYLGCNALFAQDAGITSAEEIAGYTDYDLSWTREQSDHYRSDDQQVVGSGIIKLNYEELLTNAAGETIWIETSKVPLQSATDEIIGVLGIYQDITQQKHAEDSMRLSAMIFQTSNEAIMITDERNRILQINPAFTQMTGFELHDVIGKKPSIFYSGKHDKGFYQKMWRRIRNEDAWQGEIWDLRKDGTIQAKWLNISVVRDDKNQIKNYISQFSDITEKKRKDSIILTQANYDQLTNLPNRNLFKQRLETAIEHSDQINLPLSLLLFDLDHFKDINDTLGHDKGDALLREVALRIGSCIDASGTVARLGGDEFAIIVPDSSDDSRISTLAQKIIQQLNKPFNFGENEVDYYISTSIGIAHYPLHASNMESLMKHADQAMYAAKMEGRNRFCYFTPSMQQAAHEKMSLTHELRRALSNHELFVVYQPILELATGRVTKAEALVRWQHPQRGMISPATFIPLAEGSGLILEIGKLVFKESITLINRWYQLTGQLIQISVNLSPVQFRYMDHCPWLPGLKQTGLPGHCINIEITEGVLLKDSPVVQEFLLELRNSGIEVAIDDFGTGFSSLSYLKKFDIDYLKIDRSFINQLTEDATDRALVEAIIAMANKLDIRTIAEGVETKEQQDLLARFGCDYIQGFYYSIPLQQSAFEQLLIEQSNN